MSRVDEAAAVVDAALAYEVAWNEFRVIGSDWVTTRVEKARAHQALLDAVRRYKAADEQVNP